MTRPQLAEKYAAEGERRGGLRGVAGYWIDRWEGSRAANREPQPSDRQMEVLIFVLGVSDDWFTADLSLLLQVAEPPIPELPLADGGLDSDEPPPESEETRPAAENG